LGFTSYCHISSITKYLLVLTHSEFWLWQFSPVSLKKSGILIKQQHPLRGNWWVNGCVQCNVTLYIHVCVFVCWFHGANCSSLSKKKEPLVMEGHDASKQAENILGHSIFSFHSGYFSRSLRRMHTKITWILMIMQENYWSACLCYTVFIIKISASCKKSNIKVSKSVSFNLKERERLKQKSKTKCYETNQEFCFWPEEQKEYLFIMNCWGTKNKDTTYDIRMWIWHTISLCNPSIF